jgi:uncharacterized membrane protein YecN with MAPEG domain
MAAQADPHQPMLSLSMIQPTILPPYAALLALLFVYLSVRTIGTRRRLQIAIGDKDHPEMQRAMRVHANFAEYAPLGLIMLALMESGGAAAWLVHLLCLCLLMGRCLHAYGVSQTAERFHFRISGMALTFTSLAGSALTVLVMCVSAILRT